MNLAEYETKYGEIQSLHQLRATIRTWKKIMILVDPSLPYWSKRKGAEDCRMVTKNEGPYEYAVAELEIPLGALVYSETIDGLRYFRASSAVCISIIDGCGLAIKCGRSIYGLAMNCNLTYEVGLNVFPSHAFDLKHTIYTSGIHFFESSECAWNF